MGSLGWAQLWSSSSLSWKFLMYLLVAASQLVSSASGDCLGQCGWMSYMSLINQKASFDLSIWPLGRVPRERVETWMPLEVWLRIGSTAFQPKDVQGQLRFKGWKNRLYWCKGLTAKLNHTGEKILAILLSITDSESFLSYLNHILVDKMYSIWTILLEGEMSLFLALLAVSN